VNADSARLHQVLWNLLKNAIKFTPHGGRISVRTLNPAPDRLTIEVRDTGVGIDPRVLPEIFDSFNQGQHAENRAFGGLGLGLAISKAVVDLHGGAIRADSEGVGRGACFTLEFPAVARNEPALRGAHAQAVHSGGFARTGALRVLLVDDHADTLAILRRLLEQSGHLVTPANTVADAVRAAEEDGFDLLISDIGLPDGTGLDIVRAARARHPTLPAIALTGFGMEQDIRNSEEAGFMIHLTKPVDLQSLGSAIRQATSGK
jgi:CheY-like chemotaxis protein